MELDKSIHETKLLLDQRLSLLNRERNTANKEEDGHQIVRDIVTELIDIVTGTPRLSTPAPRPPIKPFDSFGREFFDSILDRVGYAVDLYRGGGDLDLSDLNADYNSDTGARVITCRSDESLFSNDEPEYAATADSDERAGKRLLRKHGASVKAELRARRRRVNERRQKTLAYVLRWISSSIYVYMCVCVCVCNNRNN